MPRSFIAKHPATEGSKAERIIKVTEPLFGDEAMGKVKELRQPKNPASPIAKNMERVWQQYGSTGSLNRQS